MKYWIAKASVARNGPFDNWVKKGRRDNWYAQRLPKTLEPKDRLIIWKKAPDLQAVGFMESINIPPRQRAKEKRFEVRYLSALLLKPVGIQRLKREPVLKGVSFLKSGPSGTVFRLSQEEASCVMRIAKESNPSLKSLWTDLRDVSQSKHSFTLVEPKTVPSKIKVTTERIIRDTKTSGELKELYDHCCQICGERIEFASDKYYSEVHHVRPLGGKHKGKDGHGNMLVVCPNHHAMFDFGVPRFLSSNRVKMGGKIFRLTYKHQISQGSINYHNTKICKELR